MPFQKLRRHDRDGQSLVEFALVLPLLLLLLLGIINLGYMIFMYAQINHAAREGARAAAVLPRPPRTS